MWLLTSAVWRGGRDARTRRRLAGSVIGQPAPASVISSSARGGSAMILGLRTAIYPTPDLARGKEWYRQVLGRDPYFDEPFYVGFSVGGFELGLIPDGEPGAAGVQVYWGVPDASAELARLTGLGAEVHEPV